MQAGHLSVRCAGPQGDGKTGNAIEAADGRRNARSTQSLNEFSMKKVGIERWHSNLEEMISIRSSNTQVFKDNYWAQNGFEELRRYVKLGSDFSKELSAILQERVDAELYYSKCLAKLGAKLSKACRENVGTCAEAWKHVAQEMDKRAEIHRQYSGSLLEDVVKPMKHVIDSQHKLRKKIEGGVDKTTRSLTEWRTAEAKSKKQSHAAARENEKLQDAVLDMSRMSRSSSVGHIPHAHSILSAARAERLHNTPQPNNERDTAKIQVKKRKSEDAVKKAEVEYYTVCVQAERARLEWETAVVRGASMMESLEEERLNHMKTSADVYFKLSSSVAPQITECIQNLAAPILSANADSDMKALRGVRSAPAGACEQLLPDFYCEHTTLAMNRERRKQALTKILQLIKQDIERERKSKQGLEKLSLAIKQTPTFGTDDSQQNVADKLSHMRSMLTYLEASRYKITSALNELDNGPAIQHPLATHIQVIRDKQGLQQSILKVPPWLQSDHTIEVNKNNITPPYTVLQKSISNEDKEGSKLKIDHLTMKQPGGGNSAPATPLPLPHDLHPDSPLDWTDRGVGDGISNQHDSDFDEFSSPSGSVDDLAEAISKSCQLQNKFEDSRVTKKDLGKCRALYNYTPKLNDELTLKPGDIISIYEKQDDGWWSGDLNGTMGIFPATYVEEITSCI